MICPGHCIGGRCGCGAARLHPVLANRDLSPDKFKIKTLHLWLDFFLPPARPIEQDCSRLPFLDLGALLKSCRLPHSPWYKHSGWSYQVDLEPSNPKFHSFSIADPFYSTYINIGMWESVAAFDEAVGKYIPEAQIVFKDGRQKYTIDLESFEFKLRERAILRVVSDRGGQLPPAQLFE
jgi:hypothetical protein